MEKYNYLQAVEEDVKNYIEENKENIVSWINESEADETDLYEKLNDELWINDNITGNGSGSYTFSRWEAEENLCHNLDLLEDAKNECGMECELSDPEGCDVTIRCYLLSIAISNIIDEFWNSIEIEDFINNN